MKDYTIEIDTCVDVTKEDGINIINPEGENAENYFLEKLAMAGVKYKIIDTNGPAGGWPIIEYTGTKDELAHVLVLFSTTGQSLEEIKVILKKWDGENDDTILEIIG